MSTRRESRSRGDDPSAVRRGILVKEAVVLGLALAALLCGGLLSGVLLMFALALQLDIAFAMSRA